MSTGTFQPSDWESFMNNQAQFIPPPLPPLPADVSQFRHRESSQRSQQQQFEEQEPDFTVEDDVSEDVPPVPVSAPAVSSVQKANLKPKPATAQAPVPLPQPTAYKTTKSGPPRPSSSSGANIVDLGHLHAKYEKELAQHQEEEEKKTQPAPAAAAAAKPKPVPQSKTAPVAKPPVQKNSKEDDDDEEESETTKPKEAPKMKQQQQQQHTTTPEKKPQPVQQTVKPAAPAKIAPAKPVAVGPVPAAKKPVVSFAPKDEEEEEEQEDAMDVSAPIAKPQQAPAKPENATEKMATTPSTKHRQEEVEAEREQPAAKRSKMSAPEEPVFVSEAQTKDMLKRILLGMVAALDGSVPVTDVLTGDKKKAVVAAPAKPVAEKKPPVEFDGPAFGVYDYDEEMIESAIEIMREKVTKLTTAGTLEQVIETTGRKLTGFLPNKGYVIKENAKYSKPELSRYKALCEFIGRMVPDSLDSYKQLNRGISRLDIVMKYCKEHPPSDDRTRITAILMPEFEKTTEFMAHGIAHIIATIQLKFPQAAPAADEEGGLPDQQEDE